MVLRKIPNAWVWISDYCQRTSIPITIGTALRQAQCRLLRSGITCFFGFFS